MKPRCDRCRFFKETKRDNGAIGYCRRNAPSPAHGDFQYTVLWFLYQACKVDEKDTEGYPDWEECDDSPSGWPSTWADDWCGEFKAKRK